MIEYIRIAVLFVSGVYLSERVDAGFSIIFLLSLLLVLTISAIFKRKFRTNILIMSMSFVMGVVLCACVSSENTHDLYDYNGRYVTLTGRISRIPTIYEENAQYTVDVKKIVHDGVEQKIDDRILLTALSGFEYNDTVTFCGFVDLLNGKLNENGFDYIRYHKSRGVFFKMYSSDIELSSESIRDYSLYSLGMSMKNFVATVIDEHYIGDYNAMLKAVLTGNKKEFSDGFKKILDSTGTGRFLYPAFLHVMMFMSVISLFLGVFSKKKRDIITVFLLIIYASVNFTGAVIIKLSIMMAVFIFVKSRFGRVYYPDVLGITAIIMGLINPLIYFDVGFVMSMMSSVLIYYFYDTVYSKLKFIGIKYVRRSFALGLICTVGMIPLTAYFFGYVSVYSILVSFIMIPCVGVIVALSPFLIGMLFLFGRAPIVGQVVTAMVYAVKGVPTFLYKYGLCNEPLPKPDVLFLIIYAFCVIALVKHVKKKVNHRNMALFVAAALSVSVCIGEVSRYNDIEITFVNVGQGDGAFITAPYRFNVLIDGGGGNEYSEYNPGEKVYLEYLKTEGITKVDSAFVSHYHKDHVQGIIAAVENIRVRNLFLPDELPESEWRIALENAANANGTKVHYISEETLLTYNNGMTIRIIPPAKKTRISDDENDTTYVYHIEYGEFSAVFTGDMSSFAENNLIELGKAYEADLLKVAHHGSKTSTSKAWVESVKPKYAVICVGEDNTFNLPNDETIENLNGAEIYRTDYDGDITFRAEKDGSVKIDTFNRR